MIIAPLLVTRRPKLGRAPADRSTEKSPEAAARRRAVLVALDKHGTVEYASR
jgi:hypothetical protein